MNEKELREKICELGTLLYSAGMCTANDGNISARLPDGNILCTPTGVSKGRMDPNMLPVVTPDGELVKSGSGTLPSSEIKMHLAVYDTLPQTGAVVHAHPVFSTVFASEGRSLDAPVLIESVEQFGSVPCVKYAAPSTDELASSIVPFLKGRSALLMEFHGALTWGSGLEKAFMKMESLEFYAKVLFLRELMGCRNTLSERDVAKLLEIKEKLGIE